MPDAAHREKSKETKSSPAVKSALAVDAVWKAGRLWADITITLSQRLGASKEAKSLQRSRQLSLPEPLFPADAEVRGLQPVPRDCEGAGGRGGGVTETRRRHWRVGKSRTGDRWARHPILAFHFLGGEPGPPRTRFLTGDRQQEHSPPRDAGSVR